MCLSKVTKVYDVPDPTVRWGWKALRRDYYDSALRLPFMCLPRDQGDVVPLGRWLKASKGQIGYEEVHYPTGFHIFTQRVDAENYTSTTMAVRVQYRGLVARGMQDGYRCVVVREMYVPAPVAR